MGLNGSEKRSQMADEIRRRQAAQQVSLEHL